MDVDDFPAGAGNASSPDGSGPHGERHVPVPLANCSIARTLVTLGEKWTFLVLRDAFRGARRFEEFLAQSAIPRQVLSDRLSLLTEHGILDKRAYREPGTRTRAEYVLTEKGRDTFPIIVAMRQWGDRYEVDPDGPPVTSLHRDCGARVSVQVRCADGHELVSIEDVTHRIEPSARPMTRT